MLGLLACTREQPWPPGRVLVSSLNAATWSWADSDGLEVFVEAEVLDPDCLDCMSFQGRMHGDDVLITWSEHAGGADDLRSRVGAVSSAGELQWMLDRLDFSAVPGVCEPDPDDPCRPLAAEGTERRACQLTMAHDMAIVAEDESSVQMWVADSSNARLVEVSLQKAETCGAVLSVLDQSVSDWDVYNAPNRVLVDDGGLWMMAKGGLPSTEEGMAQGADLSSGKVVYWEGSRQAWEFPEGGFLNSPHGLLPVDGGFLYAHSLADSWDWGDGHGGTIGAAVLGSAGPTYAWDAQLDAGYLHFPRSLTDLGDGTVLVLDSGCFDSAGCEFPSQAWRVRLPELTAGRGSGAWDLQGSGYTLATAEVIDGPLWTQTETLYSVAFVPG